MLLPWNLFRVPESAPLYDILNEFQKGHSHMAVVVKYNKEKTESLHDGRMRQLIRKRSLSLGAASSRGKYISFMHCGRPCGRYAFWILVWDASPSFGSLSFTLHVGFLSD